MKKHKPPLIEHIPSPRADALRESMRLAINGMGHDLTEKQRIAKNALLDAFVDALVAFSNGYRNTPAGYATTDAVFQKALQAFLPTRKSRRKRMA